MQKIATPQDLQTELRSVMAYIHGHGENGKPDRDIVAAKLRSLASRVASTRTAADGTKVLEGGWSASPLKQVKMLWDKLEKGVAEAERQYNAAGGAVPSATKASILKKFVVGPLEDLGEGATDWAKSINLSGRKTAGVRDAKRLLQQVGDHFTKKHPGLNAKIYEHGGDKVDLDFSWEGSDPYWTGPEVSATYWKLDRDLDGEYSVHFGNKSYSSIPESKSTPRLIIQELYEIIKSTDPDWLK